MSQPRKDNLETGENILSQPKKNSNSKIKSNTDHKGSLKEKNSNNKVIAVIIIVVIGMSGIFALTQLNIFQHSPTVSSNQVDLVDTGKGNFKQDLNATTLFIGSKVLFVYVGGEFCPNCAMERWAMVMALSQFGTFSTPSYIYSSEGHIATYDFTKMSYSSSKVAFESVENVDQNRNPLEPLTGLPLDLYNKYNTMDLIPFIVIGGLYIQIGAGPTLHGGDFSGLTYQQIQSQIESSSGTVYNEILAESTIIVSFINQLLSQKSNATVTV